MLLVSLCMNGVPQRHQCPRCLRCYSHLHSMKRHLRLECGVPPQFRCAHCDYVSNRKGNINAHVALKHGATALSSEIQTFACRKCSKKFPDNSSLEDHLRADCFSTDQVFNRKQLFTNKQLIPTKHQREDFVKSPLGVLAAIAKQSTDNSVLFPKSNLFG